MDTAIYKQWKNRLKVLHLREIKSKDSIYKMLNPEWFTLILIAEGSLAFAHGTDKICLVQGDLLAVPQNAEIISLESSLKISALSCTMDFALTNRLFLSSIGYTEILNNSAHFVLHLNDSQFINLGQLFGLLKKRLAKKRALFQQEIVLLCFNLILYEFTSLCYRYRDDWASSASRRENIAVKFMTLVQQHCRMYHNVSFYAESLYVSNGHLGKIVRITTGISAKRYIEMAVIRQAYNLLDDETLSISEISESLGFSTHSSFSGFFKKYTKLTPSQYRLNHKI